MLLLELCGGKGRRSGVISVCRASLYDWPNGGSVEIFLSMVSMVLVLWGVGVILRKCV